MTKSPSRKGERKTTSAYHGIDAKFLLKSFGQQADTSFMKVYVWAKDRWREVHADRRPESSVVAYGMLGYVAVIGDMPPSVPPSAKQLRTVGRIPILSAV